MQQCLPHAVAEAGGRYCRGCGWERRVATAAGAGAGAGVTKMSGGEGSFVVVPCSRESSPPSPARSSSPSIMAPIILYASHKKRMLKGLEACVSVVQATILRHVTSDPPQYTAGCLLDAQYSWSSFMQSHTPPPFFRQPLCYRGGLLTGRAGGIQGGASMAT